MAEYKKGTKVYKLCEWCIIFLGIVEVIHFTFYALAESVREGGVWIILSSFFTLYFILVKYNTERYNPIVVQVIVWLGSLGSITYYASWENMMTVMTVELTILFVGIYMINKKDDNERTKKRLDKKR